MPVYDVAIVDYGLGNLFSIEQACKHVGLSVRLASTLQELQDARSVILPGVGAFGDAMQSLHRLGLVEGLKDMARAGKPMLGICLGQQLLFSGSDEFGSHEGLDIIKGWVKYFPPMEHAGRRLKVPQVGWNPVEPVEGALDGCWDGTLLDGIAPGTPFYFVHSCHVVPESPETVLCESRFGDMRFCSGSMIDNIVAFQFHPERSGENGLRLYKNFGELIRQ